MKIEQFLNWLKDVRGFSYNTVTNYERGLRFFDEYLKETTFGAFGVEECEKITLHYINSFFISEKAKGKDTSTCNLRLAAIKNYLKFCDIEDYNVIDYRKILYAREQNRKIEALGNKNCEKLIEYFRNKPSDTNNQTLIKIRNLCIVYLLLYTGLRVSELCNLKKIDIGEKIQVIGKGGVRRTVYLGRDELEVCNYYVRLRRNDNCERFLVNHSRNYETKKLSKVSVENIIKNGSKKAGIEERVFPHKLRHTFATELLRNDVKLTTIQRLLGHKNLSTTQTYLTVEDNELREAQATLDFTPRKVGFSRLELVKNSTIG